MDGSSPQHEVQRFSQAETVYLKPEIKMEPLVHGWHAWPHLIAPLQQGLNTNHRHLPIMRSFVTAPAVHSAASKNPLLAGGPYIDMPATAVEAVGEFTAKTLRNCTGTIALANEYIAFDRMLQGGANGYSLDSYYDQLPDSMKGIVELFYDANGNVRIRFYEDLVYGLGLTDDLEQIYIGPMLDEQRPFFMSTPRIDQGAGKLFSLPFADARIDVMAAARTSGAPLAELAALFPAEGAAHWCADYVTNLPPPASVHKPNLANGLSVTYIGHASLLIETPDVSLLVDPVIPWEGSPTESRRTYYDLPDKIDHVAISHGHHDHFCAETLLQLRRRIGSVIVPSSNGGGVTDPSLKLMLKRLGFSNYSSLEPFESVPISGGCITSLPFPGEHADLDIYSKQGFLIEIAGKRIVLLVDSNAIDLELYRKIASRCGSIDMLFLGMECHGAPLSWLYGPLLSQSLSRKNDESRRLSASKAQRAWEVVKLLGPAEVFLYAMGQETYLSHLTGLAYDDDSIQLKEAKAFLALCAEGGVKATHLNGSRIVY